MPFDEPALAGVLLLPASCQIFEWSEARTIAVFTCPVDAEETAVAVEQHSASLTLGIISSDPRP
jgi:hypothetical protein